MPAQAYKTDAGKYNLGCARAFGPRARVGGALTRALAGTRRLLGLS